MCLHKVIVRLLLLICSLFVTSHSIANSTKVIPMQKFNQSLHDQLPANILKSGELVVINDGATPPYIMFDKKNSIEGANIDLLTAMGEILGVKIKHQEIAGFPALLMGISSGRYDLAIGPIADTLERQENSDFIDYAQEFVALTVAKGNPKNLQSYHDLCGMRVAIQSGGIAEKRVTTQSEACVQAGKPAINIMRFKDQTTPLLAVQSDRADVVHSMGSTSAYFVSLSKSELESVNIGLHDDFPYPKNYQGAIVPKNSPLGPILLSAIQELFDNGTYQLIMQKWGIEANTLEAPGLNLAK